MTQPLKGLAPRYPEVGRIRAGVRGEKHPEALDTWRLTSKDEHTIKAAASMLGGDARPWGDEFEVITGTDTLAIMLPPDPLFAAYEAWGTGGCQRRCNGEEYTYPVQDPQGGHLAVGACWCDEKKKTVGEDKDACNVVLRLKVILPALPGFGVWMMSSNSVYAAMELPAQVNLLEKIRAASGVLIPCDLVLEKRNEKKSYERFERNYHVPTLRVSMSFSMLQQQVEAAAPRPELQGISRPGAPALPVGSTPAPAQAGAATREPGGGATPVVLADLSSADLKKLAEMHAVSVGGRKRIDIEADLVKAGVGV